MTRTIAALLSLAFMAACNRSADVSADSELARDLALANQTPVYPQFNDAPEVAAPKPEAPQRQAAPQSRPTRTATTPARTNTPARRPAPVEVERPRPAAPDPVVTQPAAAPAPAPRRAPGFDSGTSFGVSTKQQVCTTNMPGDKIVGTIDQGVTGANGAYLPPGTSVVLEVASVTPGDTPEAAQITLRVRSIVIDDEVVSVPSTVAVQSDLERHEIPRTSGQDKKKVIGGAIAGAIIGQVIGRDTRSTVIGAAAGTAAGAAAAAASRKYDACLPAGSAVRVTTTEAITLSN